MHFGTENMMVLDTWCWEFNIQAFLMKCVLFYDLTYKSVAQQLKLGLSAEIR